ncbi:hypothetical protein BDV41DRAFT_553158 [Aspergillus transmontanensis]|uniref:Uncharacterized protein n=1 Tax=Aspergillus transmontanensis TaxID=1034304 RepID=A0A5N6VI73_9EURO|nr:hypothetical protein BDV41DRAFT_553158 [Aspergillus transmontanensis]
MDFEAYKCLEAQPDTSHADEDQSKEDLRWCWGLLEDLKAKAQRSQQETKQEGKDIRKTLPHDCTSFQAT